MPYAPRAMPQKLKRYCCRQGRPTKSAIENVMDDVDDNDDLEEDPKKLGPDHYLTHFPKHSTCTTCCRDFTTTIFAYEAFFKRSVS